MEERDLKKRAKALDGLRIKLGRINEGKVRKTVSKPSPVLLAVGDHLTFPVDEQGQPPNPYYTSEERPQHFAPVSKTSCVIIEVGMAFGFFPWYRPVVQRFERGGPVDEWVVGNPGTVSKSHLKKMEV